MAGVPTSFSFDLNLTLYQDEPPPIGKVELLPLYGYRIDVTEKDSREYFLDIVWVKAFVLNKVDKRIDEKWIPLNTSTPVGDFVLRQITAWVATPDAQHQLAEAQEAAS